MDEHYRHELKDHGHRFDDVDDTDIAAYVNACEQVYFSGERMQRIVGREHPDAFLDRWRDPRTFLDLRHYGSMRIWQYFVKRMSVLNNRIGVGTSGIKIM